VTANARDAAAEMTAASGKGDVQVRVEWHDVPIQARSSPGRTPCGTARAPAVTPTTTWALPDAFVAIEAPGAPPPPAARVVLDQCAFAPRAVVAGATLAVTTTADHPVELAITSRDLLGASPAATRKIEIPIAGHEVDVALTSGIYELSAADTDSAWIAFAPKAFAAMTDATGQAVLRDVPAGRHRVTALVPPRAGQPDRVAEGEVEVVAGALAEVTLDVSK